MGTRRRVGRTKCTAACAAFAAILSIAAGGEDGVRQRRLREVLHEAAAAEAARNWTDAERYYREIAAALPSDWGSRLALARVCAAAQRPEDAVRWLDDAVETGLINPAFLESQASLATLRERDDYRAVRLKCARYRDDAVAVYVGAAVDRKKPLTVVVALHGRSMNEREQTSLWRETADRLGLIIVAPRGPAAYDGGMSFGWEAASAREDAAPVDLDESLRRIDRALARVEAVGKVDPDRLMLHGYSQGGAAAIGTALRDPQRFRRLFTLNTTYEPPTGAAAFRDARDAKLRVRMLAGGLDPPLDCSRRARAAFERAGIDVQLKIIEGVGHEPPPDYADRQMAAVQDLLR